MSGQGRLSCESSRRCAALLQSLRARFDWTLADCAINMGLSPRSADATLARMEQGIGTWSYEQFDRFVGFAASRLEINAGELRAALLGDRMNALIDEITGWRYARLGSEHASKLLCRLQCRWQANSRWIIYFRHLPGFLIPDRPRNKLADGHAGICRDELPEVFAAMHERFLLWDPAERPRLTLIPLAGAFSLLIRRQGIYCDWNEDDLAEVLEFLNFDCLQNSDTTVMYARSIEHEQVLHHLGWLILHDNLAVRHRGDSPVLDYLQLPIAADNADFSPAGTIRRLCQPSLPSNHTSLARSLLDRILSEHRGEKFAS